MAADIKVSANKDSVRFAGKARAKGEGKLASKDPDRGASPVRESVPSMQEKLKLFCTRFVRLNGILFTRTRYLILKAYLCCYIVDNLHDFVWIWF